MKLWKPKTRIVLIHQPVLDDETIARSFAVADNFPIWMALLQTIDTLRDEARDAGDSAVANPTLSANLHGGAQHLEMLKERLIILREVGLTMLKDPTRPPAQSPPLSGVPTPQT